MWRSHQDLNSDCRIQSPEFTCGGSNPTTADYIIYTLVSSAVGHLFQCMGSMKCITLG